MTLFQYNENITIQILYIYIYVCVCVYMSNIIHYLFVLIHAYPVRISTIFILKYYSNNITHKNIH